MGARIPEMQVGIGERKAETQIAASVAASKNCARAG